MRLIIFLFTLLVFEYVLFIVGSKSNKKAIKVYLSILIVGFVSFILILAATKYLINENIAVKYDISELILVFSFNLMGIGFAGAFFLFITTLILKRFKEFHIIQNKENYNKYLVNHLGNPKKIFIIIKIIIGLQMPLYIYGMAFQIQFYQ